MSGPEIITSSRGGRKLLLNGNIYYRRDTKKGKVYWNCVRKEECKATAITFQVGNEIRVQKEAEHSHAPNQEVVQAERVVQRLKRAAVDQPQATPAQILRTELPRVPSSVLSQLPDRENLKKRLRRERRKELPPEPTSVAELGAIPDKYTKTIAGDNFLLYDSFEDDEEEDAERRVIVFGTRRNLLLLARSKVWFLDGTFKTAPVIFMQIFVIMGLITRAAPSPEDDDLDVAVPLVYALLTAKEQASYTVVLEEVREAARQQRIEIVQPDRVLMDFELGIKNAVLAVFPQWIVQYCFFHLGQSVYRKVQKVGLQEQYNNPEDRSIKEATHMLLALAFVPLDDVLAAYDLLKEELPDELEPVQKYFEEYYLIGVRRRGGRRGVPPRFEPALWNAYEATVNNSHRTNNISEGWHNKFQHVVGKHHPSFYAALEEFRKEQADTETILAQMDLGQAVKAAPKRKWVQLQRRVRNIVGTYQQHKEDNDIVGYLRALGHQFLL